MRPWRVAVGYTAAGALAVALVALPMLPLWKSYFGTRGDFGDYIARTRPALVGLFSTEGPAAVAAAVRSESGAFRDGQFIVFADPGKKVLSGTLSAWPEAVPDATVHALPLWTDPKSKGATIVVWHDVLPGGYHLLMGRKAVGTGSNLLNGALGAIAILIVLGAGVGWLLARRASAARKAEERYERVVLASEAGLWDWDVEKDEYYVSPAMLAFCDFPPGTTFSGREDFMQRAPWVSEDRERFKRGVQQLFAAGGSRMSMEVRYLRGGETRWLDLAGMCFRDAAGKPVRWTGSATDITERKRAELGLRQSEQRYALAMDATADGHMDWNFETGEFYLSPRMKQIVGHPPDATFADRDDWVRRFPFHPEDRARWEAAIAAHFAGREAIFKMDARVIVNGETRWLAFNFIATRDAAGKVVRWTGSIADINDAKRDVATVVESIPGLVAILTPAGELESVSDQLAEYCGQPVEVMKHWGTNGTVHPEDVPHGAGTFMRGISTGQAYEFEARVRRFDGAYRWNVIRGEPYRDTSGRIVRWYSTLADVDDRKRAEEALRQSQERYALALEAAEEGHFDNDLETNQIFVSARTNEIYGFPRQLTVENRFEFLAKLPIHPDERHVVDVLSNSDWTNPAGDFHEVECRIVPRPGEIRWIHSRAKVVRDAQGRPRRRVGVVADITERKVAEEALRESQDLFARAVAGSADGIWDIDLVARSVYFSPRTRELCGLPPGPEVVPLDGWFEALPLHPEDLPRRMAAVQAHLSGKAPAYDGEFRFLQPDGVYRWRHLHGVCVRDAEGRPLRMAGSMSDVDDRRRAEDALRLSEERYALALEAAEEGHFDSDLVTNQNFASARTNEIFGLPRQATVTDRLQTLAQMPIHPDDLHIVGELGKPGWGDPAADLQEIEFRIVPRPGEIRWIHSRAKVARDAQGRPRRRVGVVTDITDRKLAEEALRESQERFARAVAGSTDGIWDIDLVARSVYFSPRTRELCGLPPGPEVVRLDGWFEALPLHPEDLPRRMAAVQAHLSGKAPAYDGEFRFLQPDGVYRWRHLHGVCVRDAEGRPLRMAGSMSDVDDRRQAEEALRAQTERFRGLTDLSSDWYWEQDEALRFTFSSAAIKPPAGHPGGSSIGLTRWELPGIVPLSTTWEEHKALVAARKPFRDFEYSRPSGKDGTIRYISVTGTPIFDQHGEFRGYYGVGRDITERRRAVEALRESQLRYERAMVASRAGYWDYDLATDEYYLSPAMLELAGFPPGTAFSGRDDFLLRTPFQPPEERDNYLRAVRGLFVGDGTRLTREVRLLVDGNVRWINMEGMCLRDAAGKVSRWTGFATDITARKHAEEDLRKMEERLRLAQRLEGMGTLAGGIAHDFNNILGAVLGYGEMAMRSAKKGSRLHRDLDSIMAAGERGRALVDRVLAFSRSGVADRVPVHVEAVVREVLDQVAARLPASVSLEPSLRAGRAAMLGDSTQVHQVVMNLASNAVQAMPTGGVLRVALEATRFDAPRPATIGSLAAGDYIVLRVSDSGTGIPADVLERMFDPFFTTKEVGVGSGLGLSLVHGIVTSVGGAIDVATEPGHGSTFTVYLRRSGEAVEKPAEVDRPLPRGRGQRVLVVDDEEPLVRLTAATLEHLGYSPVGFTSSASALQEFGANPRAFDAILTDERMPGLTGSTIIREVRRIDPSIPILLMSGFVSGAAAQKARELGASDVLKKPVLARDLAASLARALQL